MLINIVCFLDKEAVSKDKAKGSDSVNPVIIAVPVVLLLLIIPALLIAVLLYRRYVKINWYIIDRVYYSRDTSH